MAVTVDPEVFFQEIPSKHFHWHFTCHTTSSWTFSVLLIQFVFFTTAFTLFWIKQTNAVTYWRLVLIDTLWRSFARCWNFKIPSNYPPTQMLSLRSADNMLYSDEYTIFDWHLQSLHLLKYKQPKIYIHFLSVMLLIHLHSFDGWRYWCYWTYRGCHRRMSVKTKTKQLYNNSSSSRHRYSVT